MNTSRKWRLVWRWGLFLTIVGTALYWVIWSIRLFPAQSALVVQPICELIAITGMVLGIALFVKVVFVFADLLERALFLLLDTSKILIRWLIAEDKREPTIWV